MLRKSIPAISLLVALSLAACGGSDEPEVEQEPFDLVIGDSIPLTGQYSDLGRSGQKAADLAVEQINDAIGEAGVDHTVEIVHKDNASDPATAEEVAREMVDADDASCIIGAWGDPESVTTADAVAIPEKLLQISPASTTDELTRLDDGGLVDRTVPPASNQALALVQALEDDLGGATGKTVNVGGLSDSTGQGFVTDFIEEWTAAGGDVGAQVLYGPDQDTYSTVASDLTEGDPDAYVIADQPATFAQVAAALDLTGVWDPAVTWGTNTLISQELVAEDPELLEGLRATVPGAPEGEEATTEFETLFTSSDPANVKPQRFAAQQFDAAILCYLAAAAANSGVGAEMAAALVDNTAPGGTEYTWQELADAIEAVQGGDDIDYTGASGPIDMDENGDATGGVYDIYQYRGGVAKPVKQVPVPAPSSTPAE
jgi:ABC-type branched-subunit amino acid transport system substrate-binding protein